MARKGLLALGISLLAVALLVVLEGLALRWLGREPFEGADRYSLLQFCPPRGKGVAAMVFWRRGDKPEGGLEHFLQLHEWPLNGNSRTFQWDELSPRSSVWTGAGETLAIGGLEGTIYTWDASKPETAPQALGRHEGSAMMLASSGDGRWLFSASDMLVAGWDLQARKLVWKRDDLVATAMALHPSGGSIVCGTGRGDVLDLDPVTGRTQRVLPNHIAGVDSVAVSSDGTRVASVGHDRCLVVTDWDGAQTIWTQTHHHTSEVCFSPAGDTLVSSGFFDNAWTLMTWNAATGEHRHKMLGHRGVILGLTFTGDNTLHSWGTDGSLRTWDTRRGVETGCYATKPSC